ncbi:hypothetical protein Patl1_17790 [Pistacia atlantica]|uniref:Uncharacterized protein n=1 Tax=Pistacia atlantica TaxID=434234 RepID=A0ACC1C2M2_9ROSI|nr:hypothetical protein Patl1_17790 [Pistacia atlantica]
MGLPVSGSITILIFLETLTISSVPTPRVVICTFFFEGGGSCIFKNLHSILIMNKIK